MQNLTVREVPVASLVVHPMHPRRELGPLGPLTADIRDNGLIEPLIVVPGTFGKRSGTCGSCGVLTRRHSSGVIGDHIADGVVCGGTYEPAADEWIVLAGARRLAAARSASLATVPCIARFDLNSEPDRVAMMVRENAHRLDLPATELAEAFAAMVLFGWTATRISQQTKLAKKGVDRRLALLRLPVKTWRQLDRGALSLEDAESIAGVQVADSGEHQRRRMAARAAEGRDLTVEDPGHGSRRASTSARRIPPDPTE